MGAGWKYREPTIGQRLVAPFIDCLLLVPIFVVGRSLAGERVVAGVAMAVFSVYQVAFVWKWGRTLGKYVAGTEVVTFADGDRLPFGRALVRWVTLAAGFGIAVAVPAVQVLAVVYTLVVLAPVLQPPAHRGIHDRVAGTVVSRRRLGLQIEAPEAA